MKPISLFVFCGLASIVIAAQPPPHQPLACWDKRWLQKHKYLSSLVLQASRKQPLDIYFLGDSITEFWPHLGQDTWKQEFGALRVLNCGVSGDTTQNILYRITYGEFDRISPKVVVLLAGINNLSTSPELKPQELARGIQEIVSLIRKKSPTTKVLLLSIFPSSDPADPIRTRIQETNECIAALNDDQNIFFLNIYRTFLDSEGRMPGNISPDGTHLGAKGYQIWAEAMRPLLRKLLENSETPPQHAN